MQSIVTNGQHVQVVCSTVGLVAFTILALFGQNVSSTIYVTIQQYHCYQWYFVASNAFKGNGSTYSTLDTSLNVLQDSQWYGRAWIIDPNAADEKELNNTAIQPSDVRILWFILDFYSVD